jgi:hypothetical protein
MKPLRLRPPASAPLSPVSAALLAACGEDDQPRAAQKAPNLASAQMIDEDPWAVNGSFEDETSEGSPAYIERARSWHRRSPSPP